MDAALAKRTEATVERASSGLLGGAVGYAAYTALSPLVAQPQLAGLTAAAAALAALLCARMLQAVGPAEPRHRIPIFDLRELDPGPIDELLLTDADRVEAAPATVCEPLVLDDILAQIGADARVVRLFDPSAMPSPGELKARIDHHLDGGSPPEASPDASQALHDALSELRRSLR